MVELFSALITLLGILMSLGHFPQAIKILRNKSAKDISLMTYSVFAFGSYVWLIYGFVIKELPIIISFIIGSIGSTFVLVLKIRYK